MKGRIYLDWNATAPLRPEARQAMVAAMDLAGNPSSVHGEGRAAKAALERARAQVAALVGCLPDEVVFTSGATEAAALALAGRSVAAGAVEHDCVGAWAVEALPVDASGQVDVSSVAGDTVAVQAANSETGIVQEADVARSLDGRVPRPLYLCDAVQAVGRIRWRFDRSRADLALVSSHKLGGPKGVGALIVKQGLELPALLRGGGQEMGRRSGTENVGGIAGFGAACAAASRDLEAGIWERVAQLRNILEDAIEALGKETIFVGKGVGRLPNTSCLIAPGWKGETQVMAMDLAGFAISAGSACSSGKVRESRVLRAMGYGDLAGCAVRISIGPATTEEDVMRFAEAWCAAYDKHRARAARGAA